MGTFPPKKLPGAQVGERNGRKDLPPDTEPTEEPGQELISSEDRRHLQTLVDRRDLAMHRKQEADAALASSPQKAEAVAAEAASKDAENLLMAMFMILNDRYGLMPERDSINMVTGEIKRARGK